ncbi:MAG: MATE family efflux transporter, partial [Planctomycetota bacterium]|nr:MATE family efflux transporter [Planctomycetota bacterium]
IAQALMTALFFLLFLAREHEKAYGAWSGRAWCWPLLTRLVRFGVPNGLRFAIEIGGWSLFLLFVGRIGRDALAASSIAWRINAVAFFPMIGLGMALSTLVGQAQGEGVPDRSSRATWRALAVTQAWMMAAALLFVVWPEPLIAIFSDEAAPADAGIAALTRIILRYVAAYCLLDGFNVIFASALQGAGDTRFMLLACAAMYGLFAAALFLLDRAGAGLHGFWTAATVFVMALALVWLARFIGGAWRSMRVIEPAVE